jgi:hypothetical protein
MRRTLIVSNNLIIGGAEKLIFELVTFCLNNHIQPTVLIANNYNVEDYDDIFKKMNIKVVRTTMQGIKRLRNPMNFFKALLWKLKLKYFADKIYSSVHVIGLYNVSKTINAIKHPNRFYWHVTNTIQYFNEVYPFHVSIFRSHLDTLICINSYQVDELNRQYGIENIRCQVRLFKLFITDL